MDSVERKETASPKIFLACKYDDVSCDIFVFLTESGLRQLHSSGNDGLLSYRHEQTSATIEVINISPDDTRRELQVICSTDPEVLWYRVRISDKAYGRLQSGDTVGDRYENGMGSKVTVVVNDEMVEALTSKRRASSSQLQTIST